MRCTHEVCCWLVCACEVYSICVKKATSIEPTQLPFVFSDLMIYSKAYMHCVGACHKARRHLYVDTHKQQF